jgi:hypothetical protein
MAIFAVHVSLSSKDKDPLFGRVLPSMGP